MRVSRHRHRFLAITLTATCLLQAPAAAAQASRTACREAFEQNALREQRLWRSVLFGLRPPDQAGISEVRHATGGSAWIKVETNAWESVAEGYEDVTWSDSQMEQFADVPPRRGIFERRRSLSTELIPYLIQSVRAFRCRLDSLCHVVERSLHITEEDAQDMIVHIPGCLAVETTSIPACHLAGGPSHIADAVDIQSLCKTTVRTLFERETRLLQMLVQYDAAYRSVLQMSGMLEAFVGFFDGSIFGSLRTATNLIATFNRIPCFISSCDDFPVKEP